MVYDTDNVMMTEDGTYMEDWTSVDFTGTIGFDDVPLEGGAAECEMKTVSGVDMAQLSCSIDDAEICTAVFKVFAHM